MKRCLSFLLLILAALSSKAAGVQIPVDGGVLKVSFVCADIVRVQFSPDGQFVRIRQTSAKL